jgi:hypothetical protein
MFSCHLCGRVYATQNSLTRHSHNHIKDKSHVCNECHVVFSRRDLLVRHSKIHAPSSSADRPEGRRLRCHTACINCRRSRAKCDGDGTKPCTSCSNTSKECTFSVTSHRVSEDIRIKDLENSRHTSTSTKGGTVQERPLDESFDFSAVVSSSNMAQSMENMDKDSLPYALDPMSYSSMQMTAWPWLHENRFFQNHTPNDWRQTMMDDSRDRENDLHPMLLNGISGADLNMPTRSPSDNSSLQIGRHAVVEDGTRPLTENGTTQMFVQKEVTLSQDKDQTYGQSELSRNRWMYGGSKLTLIL